MKNFLQITKSIAQIIWVAVCIVVFMVGCTKYYTPSQKTTSTSTSTSSSGSSGSGSSGSGFDPLPPYNGGSGSSSSGSTGSGSSGGNSNAVKTYLQSFIFLNNNQQYTTMNDSVSLKNDGSYTEVYAGSAHLKYRIGTGATSDYTPAEGFYYLYPWTYYTWIVFNNPQFPYAETLLKNDMSTPAFGTSQIRFISLDPYTTQVPVTYHVTNYLENFWVSNRVYLDQRGDTLWSNFRNITPGTSTIGLHYRDSLIYSFNYAFESGRKYTVFTNASGYQNTYRGKVPVPTYYITRHN